MIRLINYFLKNSLVVNLLTVLIIIVGTFSGFTLQKEIFPSVDFDVILVRTNYPGSSSEDVEKLVTIPLERELKSIAGIKSMNAISAENSSIIYLEIEPEQDLDEALDEVRTAVDMVVDFPEDVDKPLVLNLDNSRKEIIEVAVMGPNYNDIRIESKRLRDQLEKIKDVSNIKLDGYLADQIYIKLNPVKLLEYELTVDSVTRTLINRNISLSAGNLELPSGDISIRTKAEFESLDDIKKLVVRSNFSGQRILLSDIATFYKGPNPNGRKYRANGKRAILLSVVMKKTGDIIKTVDQVTKISNEFFEKERIKNKNLKLDFLNDRSYYVKRRLSILTGNGFMGIFLVFGCLLLFLNLRTSLVTSLGAPIAFMTSFIVMQYLGITINLISMFALILVLGMLVDDAIILAEQFYQKIEDGMEPAQAAREAAIETIAPISATILTTVLAFGALFFMGGIMGKFLRPVPMVVIIALAASWFECFFLLPAHLKDFCKISKRKQNKRHWFEGVKERYGRFVEKFIKRPWLTCFIFLIIFSVTGYVAKGMRFELFPGDDVRTVFFQLKGPVGISILKTDEMVKKIEKVALSFPRNEIKQIKSRLGTLIGGRGTKTGSHYASLSLYLTAPTERDKTTDEIVDELKLKTADLVKPYEITVTKRAGGPPKGKAIEIELTGDSLEELKSASKLVKEELSSVDGVLTSEIDFEEGKKQIIAEVNDFESKRLGLSTVSIAKELRRAFAKDTISEIRESDEDIHIKLELENPFEDKKQVLNYLFVTNNQGKNIALSKVVEFKEVPGAFVIRRLERKRIFSISATIDKAKLTPLSIASKMKPKVKKILESYPDLEYNFGGENKDTKESMDGLVKAGAIALISIFFVLVIMFNSFGAPFVIMSAIPLGMIGVVWSFKVFGMALGFMASMGMVALVGVVVNDSIVLVNFIIKNYEKSGDLYQSVVEGCKSRLRPVFLTTITTVSGLLPIAHSPDGDPFLKPMAISFAYGLACATFVTLVFVPSFFVVFHHCITKIKHHFGKFIKRDNELINT